MFFNFNFFTGIKTKKMLKQKSKNDFFSRIKFSKFKFFCLFIYFIYLLYFFVKTSFAWFELHVTDDVTFFFGDFRVQFIGRQGQLKKFKKWKMRISGKKFRWWRHQITCCMFSVTITTNSRDYLVMTSRACYRDNAWLVDDVMWRHVITLVI